MADPSGLLEPGNIDLHSRPRVRNPDGSISTVRSTSMNFGDGEVLIPTVSDDGRILSDDEAAQQYIVSGRHLGRFDTPDNATAYAQQLHTDQEREYVGTESQMADDDTPQAALARAREMVTKSGKKMSTENLNRASLALSQGKETTDFSDMVESAAQGRPRGTASTRKPGQQPGGEHTPRQPMPSANQNKPPDTAKAGDTTRPSTAASPTTGTTTAPTPMGTRGDGTIQTPLTHDRKTTRTVPMDDYDPMGNPLGTQSPVTHTSPQTAPVPPAAARPSGAPVPVEQYVDQIVQESTPEEPMARPGAVPLPLANRPPSAPPPTDMPAPLAPGSVAPVQQNPTMPPAVANATPAAADTAQQPAPKSFGEYVDSRGGPQAMTDQFMSSPAMGLLFPNAMNVGAGMAGGARGAMGPRLALPAPGAARTPGNPNMATPPDVIPMGGLPRGSVSPPGPAQLGGPAPQGALPSSYGPPAGAAPPMYGPPVRGNPNSVPPMPPIPLQQGNQAMRMPGPPPEALSKALRAPRTRKPAAKRVAAE